MERVRFAPSPTGPLHIGGLRTALFNYLYAKKNKGVFIVRIEDTDQARRVENSEEYIFDALEWCGLSPDESPYHSGNYGPYRQSERGEIYRQYVEILLRNGKAYYAFDTPDELADARRETEKQGQGFKYNSENRSKFRNSISLPNEQTKQLIEKGEYVVRLKIDGTGNVITQDILRGTVDVNVGELEDKVLMKADGMPTYHFANVVDDHLMKITTVIRGEEWLPSLPIHQLLYDAFGWETPQFLHLPLILNPGGKGKLSKRDGEKHGYPVFPLQWGASRGYKDFGFLPEAHVNYIAQLGWSLGENELISLNEMIDEFDISRLQKGGARFDFDKAKWVNQQYIGKMTTDELMKQYPVYFKTLQSKLGDKTLKAVELIHERFVTLADVEQQTKCFYQHPSVYDSQGIKRIEKFDVLFIAALLKQCIQDKGVVELKEEMGKFAGIHDLSMGALMQVLRMSVVGALSGPDLVPLCQIIGKNVTLDRITQLITHIKTKP